MLNRKENNSPVIVQHEHRQDNPHNVTKGQPDLGNVDNFQDAGTMARSKLQHRKDFIARNATIAYIWISTIIAVVSLTLGYMIYTEYSKGGRIVTDIRPCLFVSEDGYEITGKREYSYPNRKMFGLEFRDPSEVTVKTTLDLDSSPMNITGISNAGWWTAHSGMGETGVLIMKPSDLYVFNLGSKTYVVNDKSFCR